MTQSTEEQIKVLREALQNLENACEQLAAARTMPIYTAMIEAGQTQELLALDGARRFARDILADQLAARADAEGEKWQRPTVRTCQSDEEVCPHMTGKGCDCPLERVQVAAVIDVAQRAFEASGEPTVLSVDLEVLDGIEHIRIITAPCSILLPLSAARIVFGSLIPSPDALAAAKREGWGEGVQAAMNEVFKYVSAQKYPSPAGAYDTEPTRHAVSVRVEAGTAIARQIQALRKEPHHG